MSVKMATIWNPNKPGSKQTWEVGKPMPSKGFQLWTGGKASESVARSSIKSAAASKLREVSSGVKTQPKIATTKAKAASTLRKAQPLTKQSTYIGETNWKKLQKKYHPAQLKYATELKDGHRMWRPRTKITDFKFSKEQEKEIERLKKVKK